jgi:L-alanine-DL-glutamate epimerase-like enolase superfamily enzyme
MKKEFNVRAVAGELYFLPVETRVPLKFGAETLTSVVCARVRMTVEGRDGRRAEGWGETPLSASWVWPSSLGYKEREAVLKEFCRCLARAWRGFEFAGHPIEIGSLFIETELKKRWAEFNRKREEDDPMPWLAALVCCSAFDIALHDVYGNLHHVDIYETYNAKYMNADLGHFLTAADDVKNKFSFAGKYPADFLVFPRQEDLWAWHLVGGKDPVEASELTGREPQDGYPALLRDWIRRDGLKCLKVKLRGNDGAWDYDRLAKVGEIGIEEKADWLTADFNCMVTDPGYVNEILDRLAREEPRIYGMILYIEQPFPYDLETAQIDVHSVSARKPLFMDESCHDWRMIRLGRELGWTGVALKTCKTQTGAILSLCWAKAHGMTLMVQDLTNPMLAQIPHCRLAAHAGTIMGVETNAMQFYPEVSGPEAVVHPGLYTRRGGKVTLSSLRGPGFGYRIGEIARPLPDCEKE